MSKETIVEKFKHLTSHTFSTNPNILVRRDEVIALVRQHSKWQPIETAPRDGTPFLIFGTDKNGYWKVPEIGYWEEGWFYEGTPERGSAGIYRNPTHWMPLPPKPE